MRHFTSALLIAALAAPIGVMAQASPPAVPSAPGADAVQVKKLQDEVRLAQQAKDSAGVFRASRRLLELYPNEPIAQAAIYQAMAASATDAGQSNDAAMFGAAAVALDPAVGDRVIGAPSSTRGKGEKLQAALTVLLATVSAVQEARASMRQQAPPQGMMGGGMAPGGMPPQYPQGGQYPQGQYPQGGYPPAPVGAPGYQQPQAPPPYPGYGPPAGQPPVANYYQGGPPPGSAPMNQPYGAPMQYAAPPPMRGAAGIAPIRVLHDHSLASDATFFGPKSCGALLAVDGPNLTFTPGGGEAALIIPSSDLVEIRLNTAVGSQIGAFHVVTKKGLYLHLAPASGLPADGRAAVDSLRAALKL